MKNSSKTKTLNMICVGLVLISCVLRLIGYELVIPYNGILCVFYCSAAFLWLLQLQKRLIQPNVRKYLTLMAKMMIFWIIIRTIKYDFTGKNDDVTRYIWYMYYIPQILIVLWMFFTVLQIGKPYNRTFSRRWYLLYIPALLIIISVLTNDFHQMAFCFPYGLKSWNDFGYSYGFIYFLVLLWDVIFCIAVLLIAFIKCSIRDTKKNIWMPMLPLFAAVVYGVMFFIKPDSILLKAIRVPELFCFVFAAFMESLILAHLIPSNDNYGDFWNVSSIGAGIMDMNGNICYKSQKSMSVGADEIYKALVGPVLIEDGNIVLNSQKVDGGIGYWIKDISQINCMNKELEEIGDVLAKENELLDAKNKIMAQRTAIEEKNKLYDDIAVSNKKQLNKLDKLLQSIEAEPEFFEQKIKYACILNAYIKRHSNLLLQKHQSTMISSDELKLAINESVEYVRLYGAAAYAEYVGTCKIPASHILLFYELFEEVLECALPDTDAVFISVSFLKEEINMRMELNAPRRCISQNYRIDSISRMHGSLSIEKEEHTEYVTLMLPAGGEHS